MKLVILAAAVIVAKSVNDPLFMEQDKLSIAALVIVFGVWEVFDYLNKNKKQ